MSPGRNNFFQRRGFTLVEATLAIAITAILLTGMGAALIASASAADMGRGASAQTLAAQTAMDQIRAEIAVAKSFKSRTSTGVVFRIADRDGDGADETIEYSWSGVAGAPLLRSYNSGPTSAIISACESVNFGFLVQPAPVMTLGASRSMASFVGDISTGATSVALDKKNVGAMYWEPSGITAGKLVAVTSVQFALKRGAGQPTAIRVRAFAMDGAQPMSGTLLGTTSINSGDLANSSTYTMTRFAFASPAVVDPSVGAWFVIDAPEGNGNTAWIAYDTGNAAQPSNMAIILSNDHGATWTNNPDSDFSIIIEGAEVTVTYPAEVMQ